MAATHEMASVQREPSVATVSYLDGDRSGWNTAIYLLHAEGYTDPRELKHREQKMRVACIRLVLSSVVLLALCACAPLPNQKYSSDIAVHSTIKDIPACGVRVQFSGTPSELAASDIQKYANALGEYAKWEVTGWHFNKHRLRETAICLCRDYPLTAADVEGIRDPNVTGTSSIRGIGETVTQESQKSPEEKFKWRSVRLTSQPLCMFMQHIISPEPDNAAAVFFPTLALIPSPPQTVPAPPRGTIAERLRQLDQLLTDRLVSQDEYNKRRSAILEAL